MDTTASVYRLTSSSDKESYPGSASGTIQCHLQPLDRQTNVLVGGELGQAFRVFTEIDADVIVTDKLVIDGATYTVSAKEEFNFGSFPHCDLVVMKN